jgi:hypothetical protein
MNTRNRWAVALLAAVTLASLSTRASAQGGLSIWAGAGGSSQDGSVVFGKEAKQLGVQIAVPMLPLALRADAMTFGNGFDTDALSYNVNAVVRMPLPIVQPYGILGRGRYAKAPGEKVEGWNVGVGARVGLGRFGVFGEVRKHDAIGRTITVVGLTF